MDEASRFIRYVIPGLVSLLVIVLFLVILVPGVVFGMLSKLGEGGRPFAAILMVFLGSGALGYLHANVYFAGFCFFDCLVFDYRHIFRSQSPGLRAIDINGKPVTLRSRREAWSIAARFWAYRLRGKEGMGIEPLDKFVGTLVHHVHSLGAAAVGTLFSPFYCLLILWSLHSAPAKQTSMWLSDYSSSSDCSRWIAVFILWTILQAVFWLARHSAKQAHEWITSSQIIEKISAGKQPVDVFFIKKGDGWQRVAGCSFRD